MDGETSQVLTNKRRMLILYLKKKCDMKTDKVFVRNK